MANVSEKLMSAKTAAAIEGSNRQALRALGLEGDEPPKAVVAAIDAFADAWQQGKQPSPKVFDPEDAPYTLGSLWGQQLVRAFSWEWRMVTFHDHKDSVAPAVLSPDRSLAVYSIHYLIGALRHPGIDITIALAYNMLEAGKMGAMEPQAYFNLMDGVRRIVPRR